MGHFLVSPLRWFYWAVILNPWTSTLSRTFQVLLGAGCCLLIFLVIILVLLRLALLLGNFFTLLLHEIFLHGPHLFCFFCHSFLQGDLLTLSESFFAVLTSLSIKHSSLRDLVNNGESKGCEPRSSILNSCLYFASSTAKHLRFIHELADNLLLAIKVVVSQLSIKVACHTDESKDVVSTAAGPESPCIPSLILRIAGAITTSCRGVCQKIQGKHHSSNHPSGS